jgi:hypothetical protein
MWSQTTIPSYAFMVLCLIEERKKFVFFSSKFAVGCCTNWLRHCATAGRSRVHWLSPSGRTMALGSTHSLTDINTRYIYWGAKSGRCIRLTTLPHSCGNFLDIWEHHSAGTVRAVRGLPCIYLTFKRSNCIYNLSNISEIAVYSARSIQVIHIYIATAAQSYKLHFTQTAP